MPSGDRNYALDGLRGLAALSVALGHCDLSVSGLAAWSLKIGDLHGLPPVLSVGRLAYLIFPSDAAVTLFFVLSGHVLWESFFAKYPLSLRAFPEYLSSRFFRLWPTAIACGIPLGLIAAIWGPPIEIGELASTMTLLSIKTNGVLWSLQIEVVCSLLLFFVWLAVRRNTLLHILAFLLSLAAFRQFGYSNNYILFFASFMMGAFIAKLPDTVRRNTLLILIGIPLLVGSSIILGHDWRSRYAETLGAFLIVANIGKTQPAFMSRGPVHFLGRISYPFYLSHIIGLKAAAPLVARFSGGHHWAAFLIYVVVSLAVTIPLAWVIHIAVEAPAMRWRPRISYVRHVRT
jgi:peptidoglycan/LPS O-acetylase OafA/YrhL